MCALCGILGGAPHWTGALGSGGGDGNDALSPPRQERFRRVRAANRVLAHYRLQLEDFQGVSYLLRNPTGRCELVADLGELWRVAETLAARPLDPLDPALWLSLSPSPSPAPAAPSS